MVRHAVIVHENVKVASLVTRCHVDLSPRSFLGISGSRSPDPQQQSVACFYVVVDDFERPCRALGGSHGVAELGQFRVVHAFCRWIVHVVCWPTTERVSVLELASRGRRAVGVRLTYTTSQTSACARSTPRAAGTLSRGAAPESPRPGTPRWTSPPVRHDIAAVLRRMQPR